MYDNTTSEVVVMREEERKQKKVETRARRSHKTLIWNNRSNNRAKAYISPPFSLSLSFSKADRTSLGISILVKSDNADFDEVVCSLIACFSFCDQWFHP